MLREDTSFFFLIISLFSFFFFCYFMFLLIFTKIILLLLFYCIFFHENYFYFFMFRDVPCSWFYRRPNPDWVLFQSYVPAPPQERIRLHVFTNSPSNIPVWNFISMINSHGSIFAIHNITLDASRDPQAYGLGGRGGLQPPQILGNSDFLGSKRKFGQSQLLKTFPCFFYQCFEEINIFYFNLKSA